MPYVSAKYMLPGPLDTPEMPRNVQAIDAEGQIWSLREDSQVGDWLRYLEEGGAIAPMDAQPEPQPQPKPAPLPTQPTEVPQAQPEVLYGEPVPE